MSVEPLFDRERVRLLVDPATRRVVYFARNGVLPERVLIVDAERQHLFVQASCETVDFAGALPADMKPQNCWRYMHTPRGLEPADEKSRARTRSA